MSDLDRRLGGALKRVRDQRATSSPNVETVFRRGKRRRLMKLSAAVVIGLALTVFAGSLISARNEPRRVPPASGERAVVSATIDIESPILPGAIVANESGVWVGSSGLGNGSKSLLTRIDPATNEITHGPSVLSYSVQEMALSADGIWAASWTGDIGRGGTAQGDLQLVDPESMKVVAEPFFGDERDVALYGVAVDERGVAWVADAASDQVLRIEPEVNRVKEIPVGRFPSSVIASEDGVWVSSGNAGTITEIDAETGELRDVSLDCPGDLLTAFGLLWVTNFCEDEVRRIDPESLEIESVAVGDGPFALTLANGQIWVANSLDNSVSRIDPITNQLVGDAIEVGRSPRGITAGASAVWVVNERDGTVSRIDYGPGIEESPSPTPPPEQGRERVQLPPSPSPDAPDSEQTSTECRERPDREEASGAYGTIVSQALTPTAIIAAGEYEGETWSLCAYRATTKRNQEPPHDSLCEEFRFGPPPHSGYACIGEMGQNPPERSDYFLRASSELDPAAEGQAFYGAISDEVHNVLLEVSGDGEIEAEIYEPPPELGLNYRFFVGFATSREVTVRVLNQAGERLGIERWSADQE